MNNNKELEFKDYFLSLSESMKIHYIEYDFISSSSINSGSEDKEDSFNEEECYTILCLHGTNQTCHTFDDFVCEFMHVNNKSTDEMSDSLLLKMKEKNPSIFKNIHSNLKFRILSMDLLGHGDSSWASDPIKEYSINSMAEHLEKFILHLKLRFSKLILIGMSLGGLISLHFASELQTLHLLIIVDITPGTSKENVKDIKKAVQDSLILNSFEDFVKWAKKFNPTRTEENLRNRLKYSLKNLPDSGKWTWKNDPAIASFNNQYSFYYLWDLLKKIQCSCLLVIGDLSMVTNKDSVDRMMKEIKDCHVTRIEKAGHSVQGDNPKMMAEKVLDYIISKSKI